MRTARWLAAAASLTAAVAFAAPDPDALLQRLARPAPATTAFVEVHFSPLLSRPLIVAGELQNNGPESLGRTVEKPYSEHTEIHGDEVTVTRGSGQPRSFSLQRAPDLKSLLTSFSALLGGNRAQLERSFNFNVDGDDAHWSIGLTPRDSRVSQRVTRITITGQAAHPRCMTTSAPDGSVTVMLMEEAASTPVAPDVDRAGLDKVCH
jgi:hypothetical protein